MKKGIIQLVIAVMVGTCVLPNPTFAQGKFSKKPSIKILATGGGIAGSLQSTSGTRFTAGNLTIDALLAQIPELKKIANISGEQIVNIPSQAMTNEIWLRLAKRINKLLKSSKVDGIVITHGTDTLEETAYFLNLVIKSKKPVILTGATRPYNHMSPDGPSNLFDAVALASSPEAIAKGVLVVMNGKILGARGVTKVNTYGTDGLQARDTGLFGYIYGGTPHIFQASVRRHTYRSEFDTEKLSQIPRVDIIYGHADSTEDAVNASVATGAKGIVLAGVGNGNTHPKTLQALIRARKKGVQVVRSTRTGNGLVTRGAEIDDSKYQFIVADNLSPQKARILLMMAMTETDRSARIQKIFSGY